MKNSTKAQINLLSNYMQLCIQSKPVYSNHFFAAKNGKKEPIVRRNKR